MYSMSLLTKEQAENSSVLKKRGIEANVTHFAYFTGATATNTPQGSGKGWACMGHYWLKDDDVGKGYIVNRFGELNKRGGDFGSLKDRTAGARVSILLSDLEGALEEYGLTRTEDGVIEIEYGNYPQSFANNFLQEELEKLFKAQKLNKTGNKYVTDSRENPYYEHDEDFRPIVCEEYEYEGKKYIRYNVNLGDDTTLTPLNKANENMVFEKGKTVWVEVEPIKWLVDEEQGIIFTEKIMFAGIGLEDKGITLEEFVNDYWAKSIGVRKDQRKGIVTSADIAGASKKENIILSQMGDAEKIVEDPVKEIGDNQRGED